MGSRGGAWNRGSGRCGLASSEELRRRWGWEIASRGIEEWGRVAF